ncbi:MAG: DUF2239 family protein [Pseudomonadota bacterium]|nr:DUF2239 family protein [Pseudomonadota bacterium]MEE3099843.1 DUF2239 family protein [Pseudomonadota bacterium]
MTATRDASTLATAFAEGEILAAGPLGRVAVAAQAALAAAPETPVLVLDDATGAVIDLDLRGGPEDALARLAAPATPPKRGRGRPRLGVAAREITLTPAQWDWLAARSRGASAELRRLVDAARREAEGGADPRAAQAAAYQAMAALAGDLPGFEEATRALFAGDRAAVAAHAAPWPADIRAYALRLGFPPVPARHLEPTGEGGAALMRRGLTGPVDMLNLLRFREIADYSAAPALAPRRPVSGRAAYARYMDHARPFLAASGGEITLLGEGGAPLIGPTAERWDLAMVVRQSSLDAFLRFADDPAYLAGLGHRTAALEESRLIPLRPLDPATWGRDAQV